MPNSTKEIKRRQRSIGNTQKITKAMEMVSAVKMRKSQMNAIAARPFAFHTITMLERLAHLHDADEESIIDLMRKNIYFIERSGGGDDLLVLITPDKGLVGGLNTNLFSYAQSEIEKIRSQGRQIKAISVGSKAAQFLETMKIPILKTFTNIGEYENIEQIDPITDYILEVYTREIFSEVSVIYMEFFSTLKQKPITRSLLPITIGQVEEIIESARPVEGKFSAELTEPIRDTSPSYIFDLEVGELLEQVAPFLVSMLNYHIILDANASEHSARMMAMRNASTNAEQILEELTLSYNKARQNTITQEISELSSTTQ